MNHSMAGIENTLNKNVSKQEIEIKNIESKLNKVHVHRCALFGIAFGRKLYSTSISQNLESQYMSTNVVCIICNLGKTSNEKIAPPLPAPFFHQRLHAPQVLNDN